MPIRRRRASKWMSLPETWAEYVMRCLIGTYQPACGAYCGNPRQQERDFAAVAALAPCEAERRQYAPPTTYASRQKGRGVKDRKEER